MQTSHWKLIRSNGNNSKFQVDKRAKNHRPISLVQLHNSLVIPLLLWWLEVSNVLWPFSTWRLFSSPPTSRVCGWTLTGCHRWRGPWWRHWSGQIWAQSQTRPWRCSWTAASRLPSWSAAIQLQQQSQPGNKSRVETRDSLNHIHTVPVLTEWLD